MQAALKALIERQLQLIEVNRYVPPEPSAAEIEAGLAQVRARFDSQAALEAAMRETGVQRRSCAPAFATICGIETYLQQRFGGSYQPSEEEVARYYRPHESDFIRNGVLRPYEEVRDEARQRLVDERAAPWSAIGSRACAGEPTCTILPEVRTAAPEYAYRSLNTLISGPGCSALGVKRITSWLCPKSRA